MYTIKSKERLFFYFIFTLISSCQLSCTSNQSSTPATLVRLDSLITDSLPFFSIMRSVETLKDTSIDLGGLDIDSPIVSKILTVDYTQKKYHGLDEDKMPEMLKNGILFIEGTKNKQLVVVFDTDNDGSLLNEKVRTLGQMDQFTEIHNINFTIDGQSFKRSYFIKPITNLIIKTSTEALGKRKRIHIVALPIYRYGLFAAKDSQVYKFALFNLFQEKYNSRNSSLVIVPATNEVPSATTFPVNYKVGDTLYLNKQVYRFQSVNETGDAIEFKHLEELERNVGVNVGNYAFTIRFNDIVNGKPYETGNSKKYVLLDFWGTWCPPCIEQTGDLKRIYQTYKSKDFELIGIAYDDSEKKVRNYLQKNDIEWVNAYDHSKNSMISEKFKVNGFPTLILLNPEGKIVVRGTGKKALQEVERYLQSID